MGKKAIGLIVVIILILIISIGVVGITLFITHSMRLAVLKFESAQAIFLAQAGIYRGIRDLTVGQLNAVNRVQVGNSQFYSYGKGSNYLFVDPSKCHFIAYKNLRNIPIGNKSRYWMITVNQLIVDWDATNSPDAQLERIYLGGAQKATTPPLPAGPGTVLTLNSPFYLTANNSYTGQNDNRWEFTNPVRLDSQTNTYAKPITITFVLSDGSKRKVHAISKDFYTGNGDILITATGFVGTISAPTIKRSIEATHSGTVITSWQETAEHI